MDAIVYIPLLLGPHPLHWPGGASHCHSDLSWLPRSVEWYHTAKKEDKRQGERKLQGEVISQQPQDLYMGGQLVKEESLELIQLVPLYVWL